MIVVRYLLILAELLNLAVKRNGTRGLARISLSWQLLAWAAVPEVCVQTNKFVHWNMWITNWFYQIMMLTPSWLTSHSQEKRYNNGVVSA